MPRAIGYAFGRRRCPLRFANLVPLLALLVKLHPLAVEALLCALQITQMCIPRLAELVDLRLQL